MNVLLRFAQVDPWKLTNGKREELLDDLYEAFYGLRRDPATQFAEFTQATTSEGLRDAHLALNHHLKCNEERHFIDLAAHQLVIFNTPDRGEYAYRFISNELTTLVFLALADSLWMSRLKREDIVHCSNCKTQFVPLRKPRKGKRVYCSKRCANVIASRNWRASQKEKKMKKKRKPK